MRSLVVTPTPTHPTNQGNRARVAQLASALHRRGAVEILYSAIDGSDRETLDAMRAAWDVVHVVPPMAFRPRRRAPGHWGLDEWVPAQLVEAARHLAATARYDVVVVNYVWCSLLLQVFRGSGATLVLDTHDVFGDRHHRARAAGLDPHWFYTTRAEETRGLDRADIVLAIQPAEGADFARRSKARVAVVEYAAAPVPMPPRTAKRPVVGYFGSSNPWNVASLTEFDRLLGDRPIDAELLMLGGITRAVGPLRRFRSDGMVGEVADAYAALDLVVNPMQGGTGLKIKTVEALAHGRAVLSTADGGAGLESCGAELMLAGLPALVDRLSEVVATPAAIAAIAADQTARYADFHAGVARRLEALVAGWAAR